MHQSWVIICDKYNLPVYYINNSSCYYSFTPLFLWGSAGPEKVIHICLLLIKYYKGTSIIHQALDRRISNFIYLWWLMIMFSMRCKERCNALSIIIYFNLPTLQQTAQIQGHTQLGTFRITSCLVCCHLYVSENILFPNTILSTSVTQDCPDIMWL